jgi:16S rRNA processing protein RimM
MPPKSPSSQSSAPPPNSPDALTPDSPASDSPASDSPASDSPTPNAPAQEFLEIGVIVGAQGVRGQVRVYPQSDFPERFLQPGPRWLLAPGATLPQPVELVKGHGLDNKGLYVVTLAGIDDRATAEALKHTKLLVPLGDRPHLDPDEFHVADLIGLAVFDQASQTFVGTVVDLLSAGHDLLQVEVPNPAGKPKLVLIPFVTAIVPVVDLAQGRIEITPPAGLVD